MTEDLGVMSDTWWTGEDRYVNCIVTHNVCARDLTPDPAPDTCHHVTTPTGTLLTLVHIYLRLSRVMCSICNVAYTSYLVVMVYFLYLSQTVTCPGSRDTCHHVTTATSILLTLVHIDLRKSQVLWPNCNVNHT